MSPRILELEQCPHCGAELPHPTPRICPQCGGSLQKRYLTAGCLTSKPMLALIGASVGFVAILAHLLREALRGA